MGAQFAEEPLQVEDYIHVRFAFMGFKDTLGLQEILLDFITGPVPYGTEEFTRHPADGALVHAAEAQKMNPAFIEEMDRLKRFGGNQAFARRLTLTKGTHGMTDLLVHKGPEHVVQCIRVGIAPLVPDLVLQVRIDVIGPPAGIDNEL